MHRLDVEIEGKVPVRIGAVENTAVMDEAGAIHQKVSAAEIPLHIACQPVNRLRGTDVEPQQPCGCKAVQFSGIEIGRNHLRAFRCKRFCDCAANALACGGDDCGLACQTAGHG